MGCFFRKNRCNIHSFTLVEVIFVVSIVGILMSIFLPSFSNTKENAHRIKDVANMKKYAEAWTEYTVNRQYGALGGQIGGVNITYATGAAELLAGGVGIGVHTGFHAERSILNNPNTYISSGDSLASSVKRDVISIDLQNGGTGFMEPWTYVYQPDLQSGEGVLFSYSILMGAVGNVDSPETLPVAFSRGLMSNGLWNDKYGLYGNKGGYVMFADGHFTWFKGDKAAKFLKWDRSGYSSNILDAIPQTAKFHCGDESILEDVQDSEGNVVLVNNAGKGL